MQTPKWKDEPNTGREQRNAAVPRPTDTRAHVRRRIASRRRSRERGKGKAGSANGEERVANETRNEKRETRRCAHLLMGSQCTSHSNFCLLMGKVRRKD